MTILTKTIVSTDSVAWLGLKHFILTGAVLFAINLLFSSVFGFFWSYGVSDLVVYSVLTVMLFISVCISSFYFQKKTKVGVSLNKVFKWSFAFAVFVYVYLILAYVDDMSVLDLISSSLILIIYYSTGYLIFKKSKQALNV